MKLSLLPPAIHRHLKHPANRLLFRFLPSLIGLSVIAVFLITQPKTALDFKNQILTRLGLLTPALPTLQDPPTIVNAYRQQAKKPALQPNSTLDSLAGLISLTYANAATDEPKIDLKQLSQLAGYRYSNIAYFALINPTPQFPLDYQKWLSDNQKEILSTTYTQIGFSSIYAQNKNNELILIIILASPSGRGGAPAAIPSSTVYTGVDLWNAVQDYRTKHGVPPYRQDSTLCTIASIRLNQQLDLGKLDNHDGFAPLIDRFRKDGTLTYTNVGENLVEGYETAITAWDGSPGHSALLKDGAYVWGCTAANHGFGVLIAAF